MNKIMEVSDRQHGYFLVICPLHGHAEWRLRNEPRSTSTTIGEGGNDLGVYCRKRVSCCYRRTQ